MSGKNSTVNTLATHKQLLVVANEIHRAELGRDWRSLCTDVTGLAEQVGALGCLASAGKARRFPLAPTRHKLSHHTCNL